MDNSIQVDNSNINANKKQDAHSSIQVDNPNINVNTKHDADSQIYTLNKAALRGDWKDAERVLRLDIDMVRTEITKGGDTALHLATIAKQTAFVRKLVELMNKSDLEIPNERGNTAFCLAAVSGVVEIAKVMYEKNNNLPTLRSSSKITPLEMAISLRKRNMAEYLYQITPFEDLNEEEKKEIFLGTIHTDMYGISLQMLGLMDTSCIFAPTKNGESALQVLAQKPLSDNHNIQGRIWERFVGIIATVPHIPYFKRIKNSLQMMRQASELVEQLWKLIQQLLSDSDILKLIQETQILYDAAKVGNVEFLTLLIQSNPDLIREVNSDGHSIFHVAVINRQEKVFDLIYHIGAAMDLITFHVDEERNNILHLAGKSAPPSRLNIASGAALQMQMELQWFKDVEKIVRPSHVQMKNVHGITPWELFTLEHEKLRDAGEKWAKETSISCVVVATLIAIVAFATAFTVPGGYKEEKGSPIFLNNGWFTAFEISNALAMSSSTASIMIFLSLFTAQYREDDFLFSLPAKLIVGIITLLASIVCMVLTFTATFFLVYKEENQGTLPKFVAAFAGLPFALYALLNCRLWISLIHSTFYGSRFMFRLEKHRLF